MAFYDVVGIYEMGLEKGQWLKERLLPVTFGKTTEMT